MARYRILYWHDIPTLVEAQDQDGVVKRALDPRFQALVDQVAMRQGLTESDAYLQGWRKSRPASKAGAAKEVAEAIAGSLEANFEALASQMLAKPD